MRIIMIFIFICGLLFGGFIILQNIKFDANVSITVVKGPFKGINFKLMDYKVSMNDMNSQHEFWESQLGKSIFDQLSSTLQTLITASSQYVDVEVDVNYLGLFKKHYSVKEIGDTLR